MESFGLIHDLTIGAFGSVIGALIVFIASYRYRNSKNKIREDVTRDEAERNRWKTMNMGIRQGITNEYMFSALWHLFIANMLWVASEAITPLIGKATGSSVLYYILNTAGLLFCLLFFFLGLGEIMRYMRLRALDSDEEMDRIADRAKR